ncbi:MAG TPA: hypothetical protein DCM38_04210 [Gammaproteobacteria bacterium]|nr:hypothetical protein [Gammaproteobacteria bacterium]
MKCVHQSLSIIVLLITVVVVGCAGVPTQEMSDARQAMKAARDVQAEYYVPTFWAKASQKLTQAEQYLEGGQFFQARLIATSAKKEAVDAHNTAVAINRAKRVWQEVVTLIDHSSLEGRALLEKAQQVARQGNLEQTIAFANEVYYEGRLTLNLAQLERAKFLIEQLKVWQAELKPDQLITLTDAEIAFQSQAGKKAYDLINNLYNSLPYDLRINKLN